jgi:hypothetical protein
MATFLQKTVKALREAAVKSDPHARVDSVGLGSDLLCTSETVFTYRGRVDHLGHAVEICESTQDLPRRLREKTNESDRWKAKCEYWQREAKKRSETGAALDATKIADEIMARIERDGAIHKDALVEVIGAFTK